MVSRTAALAVLIVALVLLACCNAGAYRNGSQTVSGVAVLKKDHLVCEGAIRCQLTEGSLPELVARLGAAVLQPVDVTSALALALQDAPGKLYALEADVSKEESILAVFKWIRENLSGVDILVNNVAVLVDEDLTTAPTESWRRMLDVNVLGLSICTREAIQDMVRRGVDDGFVIHINGLWGHNPPPNSKVAMAAATKQAVTALLEGLRKDLVARKSHIRVGQVSPGLVKTEFFNTTKHLTPEMYKTAPYLEPEDIANAVIYILSQHPRVQVHDILIHPTCDPF